jgi:cytochrome c biogenesis protein
VRVREEADGRNVVEVGGLDRADARAGLIEDVADLAAELVGKNDKVKDGVAAG